MSPRLLRNSASLIATLATLTISTGAVIGLQFLRLQGLNRESSLQSSESLNQAVSLEAAQLSLVQKLPAFGFDNLVADWAFLSFLQYFGDTPARDVTGYQLNPEYFEIILKHDPHHPNFYFFLSGSTTLYAGMPERSVQLMDKGLQALSPTFPDGSHFIWRYKGTDELLFLGDAKAAQESFETAAEWASVHPDPETQQEAAFSRQTAEFLARNPDSREAQIAAWLMILGNAFDEQTQRLALERIHALGGYITPEGEVVTQPDTNTAPEATPETAETNTAPATPTEAPDNNPAPEAPPEAD